MNTTFTRAINVFLDSWRERPDYLGALLTGSVATATTDSGSDIDLRILYASDSDLHEMGECCIAGKVVSFMGGSINCYWQLFHEDLQTTSKFEIRRFAVGEVLEDTDQQLSRLRQQALDFFQQPIHGFDQLSLLIAKLKLSRTYKVFLEMPPTDPFFLMAYYDVLQQIFQYYAKYLQIDVPAFIKKKSRYFTNENYRKIHLFRAFPDQGFVNLYLAAATQTHLPTLEKIYRHVIEQSGGFPATDFMARFSDNYQTVGLYTFD